MTQEEICSVLKKAGKPLTVREIAELVGRRPSSVKQCLNRLYKGGFLSRTLVRTKAKQRAWAYTLDYKDIIKNIVDWLKTENHVKGLIIGTKPGKYRLEFNLKLVQKALEKLYRALAK